MTNYIYNGKEFSSFDALRRELINVVFPINPSKQLLKSFNITEKEYDISLDELKTNKYIEIKQAYLEYKTNKATVPSSLGFTIYATTQAWADIMSLITKAKTFQEEENVVYDISNTAHKLTLEQLNALLLDIVATGEDASNQKEKLDFAVKNALSTDDLNNINILFKSPTKAFSEADIESLTLATLKRERSNAVSKIIVEVDGMKFDGDETAQTRMGRTISAAVALGVDINTYTQTWVLADNTVATPTIKQLAQALQLAGEEQTKLWTVPYEEETTSDTSLDNLSLLD